MARSKPARSSSNSGRPRPDTRLLELRIKEAAQYAGDPPEPGSSRPPSRASSSESEEDDDSERAPSGSGSPEQHLDMLEDGPMRGDELIREHGKRDELLSNYHIDMGEPDREGDEMSGDEHSSGLQGGTLEQGLPGEETLTGESEGLKRGNQT